VRPHLSRLALLPVAALFALSCRSSTEPTPAATFTGQWQGRDWKGDTRALIVAGGAAGDTLYVNSTQRVQTGDGVYEEWLSIKLPFHGAGAYVLDSASVVVRVIIGGDGIAASYYGISANAGVLDITTYGGRGGTIDGTVRFDARGGADKAAIRRFENGHFRATVE
jgi:hypothetical protein